MRVRHISFHGIADHGRVGRSGEPAEHRRRPAHIVEHHAAAHVVDVVVPAVVAAGADDDRLQRRGPVGPRRHHQRIDGAPRLPHHADRARAIGARGDLLDHLPAIGQLLVGIFVGEHAFGVAGALQIDAEAEIVVEGEPGIHLGVGEHGAVAPPVGQELDDGRAFGAGIARIAVEPEMPGELDRRLAGIGHLEEHVLRVADLVPDVQEAVLLLIGGVAVRRPGRARQSGSAPPSLSSARRDSGKG